MSNQSKAKIEELVIPERISVFEDKKTSARTVALPFDFPNGFHGVLMVCRLDKSPWKVGEDIEKITITFKPEA